MATRNDITGDALVSRGANEAYLSNYDKIFRKEKPQEEKEHEQQKTDRSEETIV